MTLLFLEVMAAFSILRFYTLYATLFTIVHRRVAMLSYIDSKTSHATLQIAYKALPFFYRKIIKTICNLKTNLYKTSMFSDELVYEFYSLTNHVNVLDPSNRNNFNYL